MRRTLAATVLLLASAEALSAPGRGAQVLDYSAEGRPFPEGTKLVVRCGNGSVRVAGDPETDRIRVRALEEVFGAAGSEGRAILEETTIDLLEEGDSLIRIEVSAPEALSRRDRPHFLDFLRSRRRPAVAVSLVIALPERADVEIRASFADVCVRGIDGRVDVSTAGGSARLDEIAGDVRVSTESGAIAVEDIRGTIEIRSPRGEIEVRRVNGSARIDGAMSEIYLAGSTGSAVVNSLSGNVLVSRGTGTLSVETSSGAVELARRRGEVSVRTRSGSVTVRDAAGGLARCAIRTESGDVRVVPKGEWSARVEARAGSRRVECFYPMILQWVTGSGFLGVAGTGAAEFLLESERGAVRIASRRSPTETH
jgi:hypothetical protein